MILIIIVVIFVVGVVAAIRLFLKRRREQRAAHDARLRVMAQAYLVAAKKTQAAEAGAAAKPVAPAGTAPLREERDCPWCAEKILTKARVCKHCGRDVATVAGLAPIIRRRDTEAAFARAAVLRNCLRVASSMYVAP